MSPRLLLTPIALLSEKATAQVMCWHDLQGEQGFVNPVCPFRMFLFYTKPVIHFHKMRSMKSDEKGANGKTLCHSRMSLSGIRFFKQLAPDCEHQASLSRLKSLRE
jgi:hypothetical protein